MFERLNRDYGNYYTDYEIKQKEADYLKYASYYIMENVLSPAETDELRTFLDQTYGHKLYDGSVVGQNAEQSKKCQIRDSKIHFVQKNDETELFRKYDKMIMDAVSAINTNIFNFDIDTVMPPQFTTYDVEQHFNWHPDGPLGLMDQRGFNCVPPRLKWRKLSITVSLTDESEYEGGDFQILLPSARPDQCINTIRMNKGTVIAFPSFCAHRVSPIQKGIRKTLVYWMCGPRWT